MTKISAVPTNIITGFLGVGKTSAITNLLSQKPDNETWAVLVNEFGEIGIDGSHFFGLINSDSGVFIQEVPGGCMCCASNVPMKVALNKLLKEANPDRLLIEPTGLGHPKEVIDILINDYYHDVIKLEKTITLIDARVLSDDRYTTNETFNQQLSLADVIVANKSDLYSPSDRRMLTNFLATKALTSLPITYTEHGKLSISMLTGSGEKNHVASGCEHHHDNDHTHSHSHDHDHDHEHEHEHEHHHVAADADTGISSEIPFGHGSYIKAVNNGEGFFSIGWKFSPHITFEWPAIESVLTQIEAIRIKAIIKSNNKTFSLNKTPNETGHIELNHAQDSRIEIIATAIDEKWHEDILATIVKE